MNKQILGVIAVAVGTSIAGAANAALIYTETFDSAVSIPTAYTTTTAFASPSGGWSYVVTNAVSPYATHKPGPPPANVDIVYGGGSQGGLCGGGATNNCIDLDGTGSDDFAVLHSVNTINLQAGVTYTLTASVQGNARVPYTTGTTDLFAFGFVDPALVGGSGIFGPNTVFPVASGGTGGFSYNATNSPSEGSYSPVAWDSGFNTYTVSFIPTANITAAVFFQNLNSADDYGVVLTSFTISDNTAVPLPAAAWLLLSGIAGVGAVARRRRVAVA